MRSELLVLLVACASTPAPRDGGVDGGPEARDAGVDASRDTAADSGIDASRDGASASPDFQPLAGLPTHCSGFQVARNPEALGRVSWQPCFDGRPACEEVRVDWGDWSERGTFQTGRDMYPGRGSARVIFVRPVAASQELVVAHVDGRIEHAVRWPANPVGLCYVGAFGTASFEDGKAVIGVTVRGDDVVFAAYDLASLAAPWMVLTAADIGASNFVSAMSVESDTLAVRTSAGTRVGSLRGSSFEWLEINGRNTGPWVSQGRVVVGNTSGSRAVAELADRRLVTIRESATAQVGSVRVDGDFLVWVEARDSVDGRRYWRERRLMAAQWDGESSHVEPDVIASLGEGPMLADLLVDDGWIVWIGDETTAPTLNAYRVADDRLIVVDAPEGYLLSPLVAVHGNTLTAGVRTFPGTTDRTIWRLELE